MKTKPHNIGLMPPKPKTKTNTSQNLITNMGTQPRQINSISDNINMSISKPYKPIYY